MQIVDVEIRYLDNNKLFLKFPIAEFVQARKHKKKRINKKWLKKYGIKSTYKTESEFIK